jgi:soluble lytic murein transglycosylase-like protein
MRRWAVSRLAGLADAGIAQLVTAAAAQYGVDPNLALAVAQRESGLNPNAISSAGAKGIMQLMDATARSLGVTNPFDPTQNIPAGVRYLRSLIDQFGDVTQAVAAYDWGPGNMARALRQWGDAWLSNAPAETQAYVAAITGVTPSAPATMPQNYTLDPATGQFTADAVPADANPPQPMTPGKGLVLVGLAVGAYLLADLLE